MERAEEDDIEREFGDRFAHALAGPEGRLAQWRGPVKSGDGWHLVRLREVILPDAMQLVQVCQQVESDWRAATIETREAEASQTLLGSYGIRIEAP